MKAFIDVFRDKTFFINAFLFFICFSLVHFLLTRAVFTEESILRTLMLALPGSVFWSFAFISLRQNRFTLKNLILYSLAIIIFLSLVCRLIVAVFFE